MNKKEYNSNILTAWGIESNPIKPTESTEGFEFPVETPKYTLKLDLRLPFNDDRIGVVIINNIEYMKKIKKGSVRFNTVSDVIGI